MSDIRRNTELDLPLIVSGHSNFPNDNKFDTLKTLSKLITCVGNFYVQYNFGNLEKISFIIEKYNFKRTELWKMLSIKYKLSPNESRKLWIKLCLSSSGMPECLRQLFSIDSIHLINDENRTENWRNILKISEKIGDGEYLRLSTEVGEYGGIHEIENDINRTHQDFEFFRKNENKLKNNKY